MTEEKARERLYALLGVPGMLKIVTNEHACGGGKHPDIEPFDSGVCADFGHSIFSPHHFVLHDVVRLEEVQKGQIRAWSAEGDYCQGQPSALLRRLMEHLGE